MTSRFVQQVYKGLVRPLVTPKSRFSSGSVPSTASGSSKKGNSNNNEMTMTILKVVGGFLPGVYIGHVLTDQGIMEPPEDGDDKDGKDEDGKDKKADGKDAKDKGKDAMDSAKDKGKDAMDSAKDKGKDAVDSAKDKLGDAKDKATS